MLNSITLLWGETKLQAPKMETTKSELYFQKQKYKFLFKSSASRRRWAHLCRLAPLAHVTAPRFQRRTPRTADRICEGKKHPHGLPPGFKPSTLNTGWNHMPPRLWEGLRQRFWRLAPLYPPKDASEPVHHLTPLQHSLWLHCTGASQQCLLNSPTRKRLQQREVLLLGK